MKGAIIIPSYNRIEKTFNLCNDLLFKLKFKEIDLIISVDFYSVSMNTLFQEKFDETKWSLGQKRIILRDENIGLKKHIIECGDLVVHYDYIIILEDDILVSCDFSKYIEDSIGKYNFDSNVCGISLFSYSVSELKKNYFTGSSEKYDAFFLKWPSSWGQCWTKKMWLEFKVYYEQDNIDLACLPNEVLNWDNSWKKYFLSYMIDKNKYFLYPNKSFTISVQSEGEHFSFLSYDFLTSNYFDSQTKKLSFPNFNKKISFNHFFQRDTVDFNFRGELFSCEIDLYLEKKNYDYTYLITLVKQKKYINKFMILTYPIEDSLKSPQKSNSENAIYLIKSNDVSKEFKNIYSTPKLLGLHNLKTLILKKILTFFKS